MGTTLSLLRHGRATGHGPDAALMPEGLAHVTAVGRRLAAEGFAPARAYCSPYRRAVETAQAVLLQVAPQVSAEQLQELTPDHDPEDTLAMLATLELPAGRVLLVAHQPLLGLLVQRLTNDVVLNFSPGTLVEIETDAALAKGRVARIL
jgi:phosphohistidine phosphatase